MAAVSMFSTPDMYSKLQDSLGKVNAAIKEATIAQQAGIPQADQLLSTAQNARDQILRMLDTYFPGGVVEGQ